MVTGKENIKAILDALSSGYDLPTLSPVAMQLVERATDDACSAQDLAALVEQDPSLAVRVLKMANSAFFKAGSPVSTLTQAIVQLGFHRLRIMALSLSLRDTFPMGSVGVLDYETFWRSSLYRALIAHSMAIRIKSCNPDEAFVAGLISEIGLLIFYDLFLKGENSELTIDINDLEKTLNWERETIGADHRQVGALALAFWKFPDHIIDCQKIYGSSAMTEERPGLLKTCEFARRFSVALFKPSIRFSALYADEENPYDMDPDLINNIILGTFEQVQGIANSLKIECDRDKDLLHLMEKANQTLYRISQRISLATDPEQKMGLPSLDTLEEQEQNVSHTLEAIAHEIRNPLMAVGGFAKKLTSVLDPASEGCKYAKVIMEEALRLENALKRMTHPI